MNALAPRAEPSVVLLTGRGGLVAVVRPLGRGERGPVQGVFDAMSAESRRSRFLAPMPRLTGTMLRRLADVDHDRHGAWVADVAGQPVAIARYVRFADRPELADVAVSVADAWQGRGLGRLMLEVLGVAAADAGVLRFAWTMDRANRSILRLAARFPGTRTVTDGIVEATTALPTGVGVDADAIRRLAAAGRRAAAETPAA